MASTTRLVCAERGHKWPDIDDATYYQERADVRLGLKHVWVLRMVCERGCGRGRVDKVMPRTFELVTRSYTGAYEKIGRVAKPALRRELVKRKGVRL